MKNFTAEGAENAEEEGYWSGVIIGAAIEVHRVLGPGLLESAYRVDLITAREVIVELKSIERLLPVHAAQLLIYLRLTKIPIGLILNFNVHSMRDGIRRRILSQ